MPLIRRRVNNRERNAARGTSLRRDSDGSSLDFVAREGRRALRVA